MYKYNGSAIFDKKGFRGVKVEDSSEVEGWKSEEDPRDSYGPADAPKATMVNSDVMVDFDSYFKYGPGISRMGGHRVRENTTQCICNDCKNNFELQELYKTKYDSAEGHEDEEWERLQIMLCPPRVLGYVLKDKQWAQLDVKLCKDIPAENAEGIMDKLHLAGEKGGQETKELLLGLVKHHGSNSPANRRNGYQLDDIVTEKGQGLVVLLYGSPGVGKTTTAQTLAIATRKPLFSIGVADVGTAAKHVESNLETIFDLATTWKAILLIDEADVFLQSRTKGFAALDRSALVSVFLRVLEYYQGILFLTTNQIAQFDIAVQSRIHIALKYDELTKDQTIRIFEQLLEGYRNQNKVGEYSEIKRWVQGDLSHKDFDGRQIRNIVTSAMGYAVSRGEKLECEHLQHVVRIVEVFKKDLAYQMMQWKNSQSGQSQMGFT